MSTSPQTIIDAIDAAILSMIQSGAAQSISFPDGKSITYKNLTELQKARAVYQGMVDSSADSTYGGIRICKVTPKGMN